MTQRVKWVVTDFAGLSTDTLYDILALRAEVFVVGQECVYLDPDGKDRKALHLLGLADGHLLAYARIFGPGDYFDECAIGRVIVSPGARGTGLGHKLMDEALAAIRAKFGEQPVTISAQLYLEEFYKGHGFSTIGEPYSEEGIPHVRMRLR